MSLVYNDILSAVRNMAHRNATNPTHEAVVELSLKFAIADMSRYAQWWFTEVELKIPLQAGVRLYAFPTTDAQGNTIKVSSFDKPSFRVKSSYQIGWEDNVHDIDQFDPDWTDDEVGQVQAVGVSAGQLFLYKAPSAEFVASNPYLYARGWRIITRPTDFTDDIADIPDDWQRVLIPGTLMWVYKQARANPQRIQQAREEFYFDLAEMKRKCRPAQGFVRDNIPPSEAHRHASGGSWQRGNSDYGARHRH